MAERRLTVAVSGLGAMQPGMPLARAIRAGGFTGRFVGFSYSPLDPANYEPGLIEHTWLMPFPYQGSAHVLDRLLAAHRADPIDVILPTLDAELPILVKLAPRLAAEGIRMLLPTAEQLALRSKAELPRLGKLTGVRIPRTRVAHGIDAAWAAAGDLGYPLLVKGQFYEAQLVEAPERFEAAVNHMVHNWGYPVVLQQVIDGTEFDVIVLGGRNGELLGAVPMKKLELDSRGKAWGGVTVADPKLDELVARAMAGLAWRGLFELELIRSHADGELYLIEINPRVPAWVQLAVVAGQNLPHALLRLVLGEEVAPFASYTVGAMTLRQCIDLTCPMGDFESLVVRGEVDHRAPLRDGSHLPRRASPGMGRA